MNKDHLNPELIKADTSTKATKIISKASKSEAVAEEGMPLYSVVPVEELEKKMNSFSYGGVKDLEGSHIVYSVVTIAGEEPLRNYHFSLSIDEKVADHSSFELFCPCEAFGESRKYPLQNSRKLIGQKVTIQFRQFGKSTYSFTGLITSVSSKRINGYSHVVLSGHAPTILLESGQDCQSYEDKTLEEIIKASTAKYTTDLLNWDIRPHLKDKLRYTVQYKESDFAFLKRLATRYGEWLYWDGEQINFGGYGGRGIELTEEQDVYEYSLKMKLLPQKFSYLAYDAKQAETHSLDSESSKVQEVVNPFQYDAIKASEEVYPQVPTSLYNQSLLDSGAMELREAVKRQKQNRQSSVFYLEARSNNPNLRVGDVAQMNGYQPEDEIYSSGIIPIESYRIVEIKHYFEGTEGYYNTFVGVPRDNFTPPYMDEEALPVCEEQSATVNDNKDPQKMGRIRVQFPWQKLSNQQSPWIRLIQPHAGGGKGFYFVPEIGEEVLIGFENQNAEKPYVLGTQYNGKETSGYYTDGNDQKVIQTRSGTKIVMNDAQGSIFIEDPSGNTYLMDGQGNIKVNAPNDMDLSCRNMNINVAQNMNTSVGVNNSTNVGVNNALTVSGNSQIYVAGVLSEDIDGDFISQIKKGKTINNAEQGIETSSNGIISNNSDKTIIQNSTEKTSLF